LSSVLRKTLGYPGADERLHPLIQDSGCFGLLLIADIDGVDTEEVAQLITVQRRFCALGKFHHPCIPGSVIASPRYPASNLRVTDAPAHGALGVYFIGGKFPEVV